MNTASPHINHLGLRLLPYILVLLLFSSCTGLRKLDEGQHLYTGSRIHIHTEEDLNDRRAIKPELERVLRPKPNSSLLISRPRLWMYQRAGEPTGRGLRHLMKNRLGEEAVLFDQVSPDRNIRLIQNRLYNLGYFDASLHYTLDSAYRRVSIDYHIDLRPPYRTGHLHPLPDNGLLAASINDLLDESLIVAGDAYELDLLKRERQRINRELKKQGFFYFHPDHILFRADSSANHRKVDLYITLKPDKPAPAGRQYHIGNIYIHADYMTAEAATQQQKDTLPLQEGVYFFDALGQFDPQTITRALFLKKDSIYNIEDHDRTINHLMSLGTFRFVNLRFSPRQFEEKHLLDVRVLLTPAKRKSLSVELLGVTKSNNFAGPGVLATFTNHNLLRGAEAFMMSTNASYETLIGGQTSASMREFGLDGTLSFPRFVLPFGWQAQPQVYAPKTNISLGINFMGRTDAFNLTTMKAQHTYIWNRELSRQFRVSPLVFNLFVLGNVDESIEPILLGGTLLRRGLFEQFVIGGQFTYVFNSRLQPGTRHDWFFQFNLDMSGNLAYLLMNHVFQASPLEEGGYGVFGQSFAQYTRADADVRYYWRTGEGSALVTRFYLGAGIPYGNSDRLPYVKQFVAGGASSVRAFHPRSLGPGSYTPSPDMVSGYNIYQTGELKLEANVEYRFTLSGMFKGAVFLDAGNIWRLHEDEDVPGGTFKTGTFPAQIALGTGTGLRIDAGFFLLRFDFAFPLAKPGTGNSGYFDPVRLLDRQWRRDNLVFNLAIGYPF